MSFAIYIEETCHTIFNNLKLSRWGCLYLRAFTKVTCMAYSGTTVTYGNAVGITTGTGKSTELISEQTILFGFATPRKSIQNQGEAKVVLSNSASDIFHLSWFSASGQLIVVSNRKGPSKGANDETYVTNPVDEE